ncbi:MAG: hypothetical protein K0U24_00705 [Gammaproteobacteria bacterium]|nr:hypothetical protein [Gammaproteobacteria bacterium]
MDMCFKSRMLGCALVCSLSGSLYAATMGDTSPAFEGFVLGVGAGYVNTNLDKWTNITMFSAFPSVTEYYREDNIKDTLSPIANASYFGALQDQWLWGIKGVYKYLEIEHPSLSWSGTYQNGAYQAAVFHTKVVQEFFLTLDAGYQLLPNLLVYLGLGPSVTGVQNELRGNRLSSTSTLFEYTEITKNKTLWGGAGQVGFGYMLPNRFMLDFSYNLVVTPRSSMPTTYFTSEKGMYSTFSQRVQLLEQGLNITVNKYFS